MTKSSSKILKLSNNGDITLKDLDFQSMRSLSPEFEIFFNDQNSQALTSTMVQIPVFTAEQLVSSLKATTLSIPVFHGSLIMDAERFHSDIWSQLQEDPFSAEHLNN